MRRTPSGNLVVVSAAAPGTSTVDMPVATTRLSVAEPAGVMFGGERSHVPSFADIAVSIPPDAARRIGEVQWPPRPPGDPAHEFVIVRADQLTDSRAGVANFNGRLLRLKPADRHVLLFVHGFNTRFEEAVYRFAQITHDAGAPVVPVLFTWPSRGKVFDYVYDRDASCRTGRRKRAAPPTSANSEREPQGSQRRQDLVDRHDQWLAVARACFCASVLG